MTSLVSYLLLFTVVGIAFLLVTLLMGKLVRPDLPNAEKLAVYECGEPTIGSSFVQFDLRFYVVALLFVVFDVEVAFFFPWAAVFGKANQLADAQLSPAGQQAVSAQLLGPVHAATNPISPTTAGQLARMALIDLLVFFGILLVGFAYVWKRGYIDWVRAVQEKRGAPTKASLEPAELEAARAGG